ncbi:hypothetical protein KQ51_00017 [Candidatus Izimaplasma bacterium HR1]|uniref:hypothetical protein n=1 Tax=Candidatus Izimoplasma sp. HR1 TaxID=1541959 RepID=UPI0004F76F55|nr:hypothetical protein KQ51_00017 [Candidatus Izimaplasma bacterium HR1]
MKKRILMFVEKRQAILEIKKTHNKEIKVASFIMESFLIFTILYGSILLFGLIGDLNSEFNYLFYSANIITILGYILLRYLYELRYQSINETSYNPRYIILFDVIDLLFTLTVINGVFLGVLVYQQFTGFNLILISIFSILVILFWVTFQLYLSRVIGKEQRITANLKTVWILGLLYLSLLEFTSFLKINLQYLITLYLALLVYIIIEYFQKNHFISINKYFTRLLILTIALFVFGLTLEYNPFTDVNLTTPDFIREEEVHEFREGRITGIVSTDDYLFVKYLDVDRNTIEIYDHDFNLLNDDNNFEGFISVYEEDKEIYVLQTENLLELGNRFSLYKLTDGLSFENEFSITGNFGSEPSIPVLIDGEYHMIFTTWVADSEMSSGYSSVMNFYRIINNDFTIIDYENGVLYQSDETIYIGVDDFLYSATSHKYNNSFTNNKLIGSYEDISHFRNAKSFSNGYFLRNQDQLNLVSEFDEEELVFKDSFVSFPRLEAIYDGSYFGEITDFEIDGDIIKGYVTSGAPLEYQKVILYAEYDILKEEYRVYETKGELVFFDENIYELDGQILHMLSDEYLFDSSQNTLIGLSLSSLTIGALLFTALRTNKLVFKGGEENV